MTEAEAAFREFDVDSSNTLSFKEARKAFEVLAERHGLQGRLTAEVISGVFQEIDGDDNATIELSEWINVHAKYVTWVKDEVKREHEGEDAQERAIGRATVAAASAPAAPSGAKLHLHTRAEDIDPFEEEEGVDKEAIKRRVKKLLRDEPTGAVTSEEKDALSRAFLWASSGFERGGYDSEGARKLRAKASEESLENSLKTQQSGRILTAELDFDAFRRLCTEMLGVHSELGHQRLWQLARPGSDCKLSFQELLVGWATAIKGTKEQRGAFMFALYDTDASGVLSKLELGNMLQSMNRIDCVFERDIVRFSRVGGKKRFLTFDDYLTHVESDGESEFLTKLRQLLAGN